MWLWATLGAIFLFVFSTYIDKHLLTRYFKGREPGVLILFSSLFAIVVIPVIYLIEPASLNVPFAAAFWLVVGGLCNIAGVILYLYAIYLDEVSVVAPLFQLSPIFSFVLGYFFLDEVLVGRQLIGFILVLLGAIIVSLDLTAPRPKLKSRIFLLMLGAVILLDVNTVIFKKFALEQQFWPSMFWEYVALIFSGVILLAAVRKYREQFFEVFRKNKLPVIGFNLLNETTGAIAYFLVSYASLLAPIAVVSVVFGTQPLFLFLFGVLFTIFLPRIAKENLSRKVITQKVISALIIFTGGYLLNIGF